VGLRETVKRLEAATCANEVCFFCAVIDVGARAFLGTLKRHGVDVDALPLEPDEEPCVECGSLCVSNTHGMDEEMRAEWRALDASLSRDFAARIPYSKDSERRYNELCERDRARRVRLYGTHYDAAHDAAIAAMEAWVEEHDAEVCAALSRAPLVQRRGLAA
jgi:uncharacterized protein YecT (DUF1311 family)